jgi:hypothetical protein
MLNKLYDWDGIDTPYGMIDGLEYSEKTTLPTDGFQSISPTHPTKQNSRT